MVLQNSSAKLIPAKSVLVSSRATLGVVAINKIPITTNQGFKNIVIKNEKEVSYLFVAYVLAAKKEELYSKSSGATFKEISKSSFQTIRVPLPSISIQEGIVERILEEEQAIDACKMLAEDSKEKIQQCVRRIY